MAKLTHRQKALVTIRTLGAVTGLVVLAFPTLVLIQYYVSGPASDISGPTYVPMILNCARLLIYGAVVVLAEARSSFLFSAVPVLRGPISRAILYLWIAADFHATGSQLPLGSDSVQFRTGLVALALVMVVMSIVASFLYVKDPDKPVASSSHAESSLKSGPSHDAKKAFALQAAV